MRLLFNWHYYHRPDLMTPVMKATAGHEVTFIDRFAPDGTAPSGLDILYWRDFQSPYQLLDRVRPDKIVFADIESFWHLALNIAARNRGIPTVVLQHGARDQSEMTLTPDAPQPVRISTTSRYTLRFLLRALQARNLAQLPPLLAFIAARKRYELTTALRRNPFELRRADRYIEFSSRNATYHAARDRVPTDRFDIIGNPALDPFFQSIDGARPDPGRALLIDAPFMEADGIAGNMTIAEKHSYLGKLGDLAALRGMHLTVRLHPFTYGADLPRHPAIDYDRGSDLAALASRSALIFHVAYSSLTAALALKRPFYAFSSGISPATPFFDQASLQIPLLDFDPALLGPPTDPLPWATLEPYLSYCDGQATARLAALLSA